MIISTTMSKYHSDCKKSERDPKAKKQVPEPKHEETDNSKDDRTSLLAVLSPDRACSCEVMARAVSSDLPRHLGLQDRRASMDVELERGLSSTLDNKNPKAQKIDLKKPPTK